MNTSNEHSSSSGVRVWRSAKLEVRSRSLSGRGIFAIEPIAAGELVATKVGHVVNTSEMERLTEEIGDFGLQIHEDTFLTPRTAAEVEQMAVMINHSCDANVGFDGQVSYVALRNIAVNEELCHDYAMARTAPYRIEQCRCGTALCRGTVTNEDWRLPELQTRYGRHFMPHILHRIDRIRRSQ